MAKVDFYEKKSRNQMLDDLEFGEGRLIHADNEIVTTLDFGICEICGQDLSEKGCSNPNCINSSE